MAKCKQEEKRRDTLLLSHANPEDNEFTLWLALQLASHGYKVWSDLTRLLGGEVFWDKIEDVIRYGAAKALYVLSRTSNTKDGPLRELHLAQSLARKEQLEDFVIPLHIDDLPHGDETIEITRINSVQFHRSWAAGFAILLEKLTTDRVPKDPQFSQMAVADWWRMKFSAEQGIRKETEEYLSNWFTARIPPRVYYHTVSRKSIGKIEVPMDLPYPAVQQGIALITFAEAADFEDKLGPEIYISEPSKPLEVETLLKETDFGKHLFRLLRLAWEHMLVERQLPVYELANKARCFYFPKNHVINDKLFFTGVDGNRTYRAMVGFSSKKNPTTGISVKRYWHFAMEARPLVHPTLAYVFKPHVLFTNDGVTLWESKKRLAAARRNQCKTWWNDEWRDRTLAVATYLCGDSNEIQMRLGSSASLTVSPNPFMFQSPVSYVDPQLMRFSDDMDLADDYGRDIQEDDIFEDVSEEGDE